MLKSFINWLKGGSGSASKQAELDAANAAPYKLEVPMTNAEKIELATMQNGDTDAPPELVARAAHLDVPESTPVTKPAAMKAKTKKAVKPKAEGTTKPKAPAKPRSPKKPNMSIAK